MWREPGIEIVVDLDDGTYRIDDPYAAVPVCGVLSPLLLRLAKSVSGEQSGEVVIDGSCEHFSQFVLTLNHDSGE